MIGVGTKQPDDRGSDGLVVQQVDFGFVVGQDHFPCPLPRSAFGNAISTERIALHIASRGPCSLSPIVSSSCTPMPRRHRLQMFFGSVAGNGCSSLCASTPIPRLASLMIG